jgi:hypothetical protein
MAPGVGLGHDFKEALEMDGAQFRELHMPRFALAAAGALLTYRNRRRAAQP